MADDTEVQAGAPADGGFIDLDKVEQEEPEKAEGEKPEAEEGDDKAKPETAEADDADAGEGEDEGKPRKRSGLQRLKARNSHLMQELSVRERELEQLRSRTATASDPADKEPQEADFNGDFFAFDRAKTAYEVRKVIREENRQNNLRSIDQERGNVLRERLEAHQERIEAAKEFFTDYDQVLASAPAINREVGEEILSSDKSELIAYHLAKHPEKIHALNQMTGRELAREMGRLEGIVRAPSAKKQTSAPPPPSAVKGSSATPRNPDSDLSAWLKKTYG
jgi:hypothetical protein